MGLFDTIRHPERYQGRRRTRRYFEGWYFKLIDRNRNLAMALIPGVSMGTGPEDRHAFVQMIDDRTARVAYFRFPFEDFHADRDRFHIRIGPNRFDARGLDVDLDDGVSSVKGRLSFDSIVPYPSSFLSPGIMGPFTFVPGMECYHGIVNVHERIHGSLEVDGVPYVFDGGEGYVEKDWGRSFPRSWIWIQANHFPGSDACFLFSLADIPWPGRSFTGFLCFLLLDGRLHRFATYDRSRVTGMGLSGAVTRAELRGPAGTLVFTADRGPAGILRAPKDGRMDREIEESLSATVSVRLTDRRGTVLFDRTSPQAGMEVCGDVLSLVRGIPEMTDPR